jgi:hypothetical protein
MGGCLSSCGITQQKCKYIQKENCNYVNYDDNNGNSKTMFLNKTRYYNRYPKRRNK